MNSCSSSQMSSSWNICHVKQSGRGNFTPVLESHPLFDILQSLVSLPASWKRKAEIQSWTDKLQMFERTTLWSILKITQTSVNFSFEFQYSFLNKLICKHTKLSWLPKRRCSFKCVYELSTAFDNTFYLFHCNISTVYWNLRRLKRGIYKLSFPTV